MGWIFGVVVWVDDEYSSNRKGNADAADCADTRGYARIWGISDTNIFFSVICKFHSFVFSLLI
jgi:hypothetical protein